MLCHHWPCCWQAKPGRSYKLRCTSEHDRQPVALRAELRECWRRVWRCKSIPQQVALDAKGLSQELALVCEQGVWQPLCLQSDAIFQNA